MARPAVTRTEPALFVGLVSAVVTAALAYWLTDGDLTAIGDSAGALLVALVPIVGGFVTRSLVWSPESHDRAVRHACESSGGG